MNVDGGDPYAEATDDPRGMAVSVAPTQGTSYMTDVGVNKTAGSHLRLPEWRRTHEILIWHEAQPHGVAVETFVAVHVAIRARDLESSLSAGLGSMNVGQRAIVLHAL